MVNAWLKTPQGELIPLMKHMFEYAICNILFAVYDFSIDDHQRVTSLHESYNVVSVLLMLLYQSSIADMSVTLLNLFQE